MRFLCVSYQRMDGTRCNGIWITRDSSHWRWVPEGECSSELPGTGEKP